MAERPDGIDGLDGKVVGAHRHRPVGVDNLLQHFAIDDEFLEAGRQSAFHPAGSVIDHVRMAGTASLKRKGRFPYRLRVGRVAGIGVRRAPWQPVTAGHLSRHLHRTDIFRRAEGRRAGFHIDIAGKGAIDARGALAHLLQQGDSGKRLGILLHHRPGDGHWRHRPGERKGRDHHRLATLGGTHRPVQHRPVMLQRRG